MNGPMAKESQAPSAVAIAVGLSNLTLRVFARLLQPKPPSAAQIAEDVSRVLRRNGQARIYHWYAATGQFPPRRRQPDG
jgi:hypothetical protein